MRTYVVEVPRRTRPLFEGDRAACLKFIDGQTSPAMTRLGLVVAPPPPAEGPDALVCVPTAAFGDWEAAAAKAVAAWERQWLLIESVPIRHRDEARADLQNAVASALVAAAIAGVDAHGAPDDVGF